jgi:heterodisulfide reductase subunit A
MTGEKIGAVMVVGGGIGGIQAALDLGNAGFKVYLVEESPAIGGKMAALDKTFPTNDCAMCTLSPKLVECGRHPNIELLTYSELLDIQGNPGNFTATVLRHARSVDESKCTGCGICVEKCPWKAPNKFEQGLKERKAIYVPYAQAIPNIPAIDREACAYFKNGKCKACQKFCGNDAIDFTQTDKEIKLNVGSVILTPGFEGFDAKLKGEYGYGRFPNVVTSLEFERILSASGPFLGQVLRPSDKKHPHKIAWIQCVGSRDTSVGNGYCSSVCCMYAVKEAVIAREHQPDLDLSIFYNDIRAFGKGFESYYENAKKSGVHFVKSIISGVRENPQTHNLLLNFATNDGVKEEEYDMVVLSVGVRVPEKTRQLATRLGLSLDHYGFCRTDEYESTQTSRPGVFACGVFQGPKDIPETVMQASAAAASAAALLTSGRGTQVTEKTYPAERDVSGEPPRIGVFICHCGTNIGSIVNVPEVVAYSKTLPNVVHAEENIYACASDAQEHLKQVIQKNGLNRVVISSCTPRTHEPLFQETCKEAGLNRYLFTMTNIRDQCSWVHQNEKKAATEKSKDLTRQAISRARVGEALKESSVAVNPVALVVGGGVSGMQAALGMAEQNYEVHLVEKDKELGGIARRLHFTLSGESVPGYLKNLTAKVRGNPLIHVHTGATAFDTSGYVGNFVTRIKNAEGITEDIKHGTGIVAIGGEEYQPGEYLYGKDQRVMTLLELEGKIANKDAKLLAAKNIVLVQCVGSREKARNYCSRVCCSQSVKLALKLKELSPEMNIFVLYRDIRTYGLAEDYYRQAREKGVNFIRYEPEDKPLVTPDGRDGKLKVEVTEISLGEKIVIDADFVGLAAATLPPKDNKTVSQLFKATLDENGFFLEAHIKLRPVDFAGEGFFMCGLAHSPKTISESVTQANAAVARACTTMSKKSLRAGGAISCVDMNKCNACGLCTMVCSFGAIKLEMNERLKRKVAVVTEASCKGCGLCAATCNSGAVDVKGFSNTEIMEMVDAL